MNEIDVEMLPAMRGDVALYNLHIDAMRTEILSKPELRSEIAKTIYQQGLAAQDRNFLRQILRQAICAATESALQGTPLDLKLCVIALFRLGHVEDVPMLWEAKLANFDTFSSIDVQYLAGAGIAGTLRYLREHAPLEDLPMLRARHLPTPLSITQYLERCVDCGDFDDVPSLVRGQIEAFEEDYLRE